MSDFKFELCSNRRESSPEIESINSVAFGQALANVLALETNIQSHFSQLHLQINPTGPWVSWQEKFSGSLVILISTEPHVVSAYSRSFLARAASHLLINLSEIHDEAIGGFGFTPWFPEAGPTILGSVDTGHNQQIRLVSGALFSAHRGSLYGLRLRAANALVDSGLTVGFGGQASKGKPPYAKRLRSLADQALTPTSLNLRLSVPALDYRVHRVGYVSDLIDFFSGGEIALVIENDARYTSEKLFQALGSGVRVVYVGKSLQNLGLPEGLVVESEPTIQGIQRSVQDALGMPRPGGLFHEWVVQNSLLVKATTPSACARRALEYSVAKSREFIEARFL